MSVCSCLHKQIKQRMAAQDAQVPPEKCDFCEEINRASELSSTTERPKLTRTGTVILGVSAAFFVGIYAATAPFLMPALRRICLPFVPATTEQVKNVFTALSGRRGTFLDVGSGDGRLTLEAARRGLKSYGVELNTWLVLYSRFRAWRLGLGSSAKFVKQDLWKTDLSKYDNIVIFGVEQMMSEFEVKLAKEASASSVVVACRFPLPTWHPAATIGTGVDTVWLYKKLGLDCGSNGADGKSETCTEKSEQQSETQQANSEKS